MGLFFFCGEKCVKFIKCFLTFVPFNHKSTFLFFFFNFLHFLHTYTPTVKITRECTIIVFFPSALPKIMFPILLTVTQVSALTHDKLFTYLHKSPLLVVLSHFKICRRGALPNNAATSITTATTGHRVFKFTLAKLINTHTRLQKCLAPGADC